MQQKRLRAVYMRGGSSKGMFFNEHDLPQNPDIRDRVILAAYGSPDPNRRQIDGVGGAVSTTSKVAIISASQSPEYDVNYLFGQVSIDQPMIDYIGSCGNIVSAVGPYAIDEGMVPITEPITSVRIYQVNTKTKIIAEVPVQDGKHNIEGNYYMDGVPNPGAKIKLKFINPGGSVTGKLLPTGKSIEKVSIPGIGNFNISIVDAANPVVFVLASELGLQGTEIAEFDNSIEIRAKLEAIRGCAAVMLGLAETSELASKMSQAVPKVAVVSPAQSYTDVTGRAIQAKDIDVTARIMSMGTLHKAYALTGAICTAGAVKMENTVVNQIVDKSSISNLEIRIGHPGGVIPIEANLKLKDDGYEYLWAGAGRTARRLMEGFVFVPNKYFI